MGFAALHRKNFRMKMAALMPRADRGGDASNEGGEADGSGAHAVHGVGRVLDEVGVVADRGGHRSDADERVEGGDELGKLSRAHLWARELGTREKEREETREQGRAVAISGTREGEIHTIKL